MWKVLDVFVVLTSLWEVMVDILQAIYEEQNGLSAIQGLHSVKSFRIIRLTRLVRTMQFIRVFQFVMALRMLVDSIISTLRSLLRGCSGCCSSNPLERLPAGIGLVLSHPRLRSCFTLCLSPGHYRSHATVAKVVPLVV